MVYIPIESVFSGRMTHNERLCDFLSHTTPCVSVPSKSGFAGREKRIMDNCTFAMNFLYRRETGSEPERESFRCSLLLQGKETILLCDASSSFFAQFQIEPECRGKNIFMLLQKKLRFLTDLLSEDLLPEQQLRYFTELGEQRGTSFWDFTLENTPPFLHLTAQRCSPEEIASRYCGEKSIDLANFYVPGCRSMFVAQDSHGISHLVSGNDTAEQYYQFPSKVTGETFGRLSFLRSARLFSCAVQRKSLYFYDMIPNEAGTGRCFLRILCLPVEQEGRRLFLLMAAPCESAEFFNRCAGGGLSRDGFDQCPYAVATFSFSGGSPVLEGFNRSCEALLRQGFSVAELLQSGVVMKSFRSGVPCTGQAQLNCGVYDVSVLPVLRENGGKRMMVTIVPSQEAVQEAPAALSRNLTPREQETLSLAAQGYPNRYIAHRMEISEGTVKKLLYNGYQKLGISSRVELCRMLLPRSTAMG
jgi:DNA-binding CsgD family transcriptional regulator